MSRSEDTRYCPGIAGMMHSGLCGKSGPGTFAEGNSYVTLSDASPYRPIPDRLNPTHQNGIQLKTMGTNGVGGTPWLACPPTPRIPHSERNASPTYRGRW